MACPHSVIDHDPDTDEYYCIKCGDVVPKPKDWN